MRIVFRRFGLYLVAAGFLIWIMGGARRGFYVISEELSYVEPVTEIEYSMTHPKFLPGIETLFAGLILGGSFWALTFLLSKPIVK